MSSNIFTQHGLDTDTAFISVGGQSRSTGIVDSSGVDLGNKYLGGYSGIDTGIKLSNGQDIGEVFASGACYARTTVKDSNAAFFFQSQGYGHSNWNECLANGRTKHSGFSMRNNAWRDLNDNETFGSGISRNRVRCLCIRLSAEPYRNWSGTRVWVDWLSADQPRVDLNHWDDSMNRVGAFAVQEDKPHNALDKITVIARGVPESNRRWCHIRCGISVPGVFYRTWTLHMYAT